MANSNKEEKYRLLTEQIQSLIEGETDAVAVMANVVAAIHETMGFFWTGFYRVAPKAGSDVQELVLGPFQGPVACMHIPYGRGVCGSAWQRCETLVVPDVEQFPGHIACSSLSRSEIVVPSSILTTLLVCWQSSISTARNSPPSTTLTVSIWKSSVVSLPHS